MMPSIAPTGRLSLRQLPRLPALGLLLLGLATAAGCSRTDTADEPAGPASEATPATQPATALPAPATVQYVCPMHPHVVSEEPGTCPICGMDLVAKKAPAAAATPAAAPQTASTKAGEREVLYWYDPMRPDVQFDAPGPSPFMDMELVPRYADEVPAGDAVAVSGQLRQSLGIRTGKAGWGMAAATVRAPAQVVSDARAEVRLSARVAGWIERLHVRAEGDAVERGAVVAEVYSPDLVAAQEELLLDEAMRPAARERLERFGIAKRDIDAVLKGGEARRLLPLRAPASGVVTALNVREGARVTADTAIVDIAAQDKLWLEARVFPAQLPLLGAAPRGSFSLPGAPEQTWSAEAAYIEPSVDAGTQTVAIRFPVDAETVALPLGAWLDATLTGPPRKGVLLVPADAVIRDGGGARVVRAGDGGFTPVEVITGRRYGDRIEIVRGLRAGDEVVVSGQFLLDSEANLRAGLERLRGGTGAAGATQDGTPIAPPPAEPEADDPHAGHQPANDEDTVDGHDGHD